MANAGGAGRLLLLGGGYSAQALAALLRARGAGWALAATCRSEEKRRRLEALGIEALLLGGGAAPEGGGGGASGGGGAALEAALARATHAVHSIPPENGAGEEPAARLLWGAPAPPRLRWLGYLSSTVVYGDRGGAEVDEATPPRPENERARRRLAAEAGWTEWGAGRGVKTAVFRLAGIYGPGRSPLDRVRAGTARRIRKPGHLIGRIHRDDIADALARALDAEAEGIFNLADENPADPAEVVEHAARLLGVEPPPAEEWEAARAALPEFARSFYEASRRVRARRTREALGWRPAHPDFRSGLRAVLEAEAEARARGAGGGGGPGADGAA